jgi:glycine betaine/proline transport system substrate-binding protein
VRLKRSASPLAGVVAALLALVVVAAGCGTIGGSGSGSDGNGSDSTSEEAPAKKDAKTVRIGWIPWDEDIVVTHMWKQALESKGYEVEMVQLDVGPLFAGLAKGDIDLFLDGWLPVTHEKYWKRYGKQLEDLGIWYDNAKLALTVPDYVKDVKSIDDLKGKGDEFGGKIIGIEAGAGLTGVTEDGAMPSYGLDEYQLAKSSTPAMLAELDKAVKAEKPVVVTLWRPHWAYSELPIRDLEDPKGAMGKVEKIHSIGRKGFKKDFPELATWLSDFTMDDKTLGDLENVAINEHEDEPAEGVKAWMSDNSDFVSQLTK